MFASIPVLLDSACRIKAGKSGTLRSLHQFLYRKKLGAAIRCNLDTASAVVVNTSVKNGSVTDHITFTLVSIPIFLIEQVTDQRILSLMIEK